MYNGKKNHNKHELNLKLVILQRMAVLLVSVLVALLIYPVSAANPTINLRYNSPVSRLINYRTTFLFYNNTSCVKPCLFGVDMFRVATNVLKLDVFW